MYSVILSIKFAILNNLMERFTVRHANKNTSRSLPHCSARLRGVAALIALTGLTGTAFAADYYVVVPLPGKTNAVEAPTAPPAPTITLTLNGYPLPVALVGRAYAGFDFNTVLQVAGDPSFNSQAVSWEVVSGALPAGLTLGADGVLSGTPSEAGASSFQVKASYKTADGTQAFELLTGEVSVALASSTLPAAVQGAAYSFDFKPQLTVSGDPAYIPSQVLWVLDGTLPQGLTLNADGTITGVPSAEGSYPFTVRAQYLNKEGAQAYQVLVGEIVVSLAAVSAPAGVVGQAYAGVDLMPLVSVTGDAAYSGEGLNWRVASGALPAGLTLAEGAISGTPTAKAAGPATVEVSYKGKTAQQPVSIALSDSIQQFSGYRAWSDGSFARTCQQYRTPLAGYVYAGATGDGTYRIDPDGAGGIAPYDAHCDMSSTAGVGYTLLARAMGVNKHARDAEADCAAHGLQLFVPRTQAHFAAARARFGPAYFQMMGIYPNYVGAQCMGSNFTSAGCSAWGPKTGASWFVQQGLEITEPNGDNDLDGSMEYGYDASGNITWYNDIPNSHQGGYQFPNYVCSAPNE